MDSRIGKCQQYKLYTIEQSYLLSKLNPEILHPSRENIQVVSQILSDLTGLEPMVSEDLIRVVPCTSEDGTSSSVDQFRTYIDSAPPRDVDYDTTKAILIYSTRLGKWHVGIDSAQFDNDNIELSIRHDTVYPNIRFHTFDLF